VGLIRTRMQTERYSTQAALLKSRRSGLYKDGEGEGMRTSGKKVSSESECMEAENEWRCPFGKVGEHVKTWHVFEAAGQDRACKGYPMVVNGRQSPRWIIELAGDP
jgi:hypothetical protein